MSRIIGLDVGSTSLKAAILNQETGAIEKIVSTPFPNPVSKRPGHYEIDSEVVADRCRSLIATLLESAPDCTRILTCGQMGGLVLVDENGRAQSPYYSWRDQRVLEPHPSSKGSFLEVLRSRLTDEDLSCIGHEFRAGSTITLLSWLVETGQTPDRNLYPVTLVDAVVARLCGTRPVTEPTEALGLLDLRTLDWHRPLFEAAGVGDQRLSELSPVSGQVGILRLNGCELVCHPAVGDQQAALTGVGLTEEELSVNCSTGSQVSRLVQTFQPGPYQIRPFFNGLLLNTLTHLPAGRSLNVIVDLLTSLARSEGIELTRVWDTIVKECEQVPSEELDVDLAFFSGPLGDHGSIGQITTENLTVGALFRGAFRNMARNYRICAERVSGEAGWKAAVISGGLTQKIPLLKELVSSELQTDIRESVEAEETLLGLLQLSRMFCLA